MSQPLKLLVLLKQCHLYFYVLFLSLTLLAGLSDDISSALAHHLGDVQRAVRLIGHGHGAVYSLGLHLEKKRSSPVY